MLKYFLSTASALSLFLGQPISAFKLNRVILATDENPTYIDFWPLTSSMWQNIVGITPTLALIAPHEKNLQPGTGDIMRFDPIAGIPTSFQAQVIRLLLPALYPQDVCIISDIDMIPLQKEYFTDSVSHLPDTVFAVYRDKAYGPHATQYPMCYIAAQGKVFAEIFDIHSQEDITRTIKEWHSYGYGYTTDEKMLYNHLQKWEKFKTHCIKLGHDGRPRVDRSDWRYDKDKLAKGHYVDSHMLRPYHQHKDRIDKLIADRLS